jgi:16S rRNA (guanine1516-N2)-methyltransferase
MNKIPAIAVLPESELFYGKAKILSASLNLPLSEPISHKFITDFSSVLVIGEAGLVLYECGKDAAGGIKVSFTDGAVEHRRKFGGGKGQMIAKAVGLPSLKNPSVLDATAGLGKDGFVLASLGCNVTMVERNPVVFALLEDGVRRATQSKEIAEIMARIAILNANSVDFLSKDRDLFDVIYLDPMFPHRESSALVKKEMRVFNKILGTDEDSCKLLEPALAKAKYRVVVKRPKNAPTITEREPLFQLEGKANRFDVYVNKGVAKV